MAIATFAQPMAQAQGTNSADDAPGTAGGNTALPENKTSSQDDLTGRSLEDLMSMQVTSVSKKGEKLSRTAAAIFVITAEDIRRSGATNIPDVLRMVPGMDVAQMNAGTWAISARGLSDEFANELLVLVDGRNVYTPTFGGVLWDVVDLPLEDIERIEVVRGPGGAVWGANAVNGVVNIITRKAGQTTGAMAVAGGGNVQQGFGLAQYGGHLGENIDFRAYSKYFDVDHLPDLTGQNGGDGWHTLRGGFRVDATLSPNDAVTFQGDLFSERAGEQAPSLPSIASPGLVQTQGESNHAGGFLQSIWNHTYSDQSETILNVSYTTYEIGDVIDTLTEGRSTLEIDFQHHIPWGQRQDFVYGMNYSYSSSHSKGNLAVSLNPADLDTEVFSPFVQDEISLVADRVYLTVGAKLEHNHYTGFGLLPTARVSYSPSNRQMVWGAVSRALRTPASIDTAVRFNFGSSPGPGGTPVLVSLFGNPNFKDESLLAYEMGYRATVSAYLSFDLAAYYNDYGQQESTEPLPLFMESSPPPPHIVMPSTFRNFGYGETHGIEAAVNWQATKRWSLSPGYNFERIHMHVTRMSQDTTTAADSEGNDPHVQASLRSHLTLPHSLEWNASANFVDRLLAQGIPSYTRLDTNLTWHWREGVSFSVVGQNLLRDHHTEFNEAEIGLGTTQMKRSGYAKCTWQF